MHKIDSTYAVLLDITGIQGYVFNSNKLKENLGASYVIQQVYETLLQDVINSIFKDSFKSAFDFNAWKDYPDTIRVPQEPFDIGYIGGGNALLLFNDQTKANEFIELWTLKLLAFAPGLISAVACAPFDLTDFIKSKDALFKKLNENKMTSIPQTMWPRHGITAECRRSGLAMEVWNDQVIKESQEYVSAQTYAKLNEEAEFDKHLHHQFEKELQYNKDESNKSYSFADTFEQFESKSDEKNYLAIVHIDGNSMGQKFQQASCLSAIRRLSQEVTKATKNAFAKVIKALIEHEKNTASLSDRSILSLRPIILGGDDVTFVCAGNMGVFLANVFMKALENVTLLKESPEAFKPTSCAGVAIVKTKYPFHRGYELAEALCRNAKQKNTEWKRANPQFPDGSWLDFHIATDSIAHNLTTLRNKHYNTLQGELCLRPYCLSDKVDEGLQMDVFIKNMTLLHQRFPAHKLKELRKVIHEDMSDGLMFIQEQKTLAKMETEQNRPNGWRTLPAYQTGYHKSIFVNSKTPYFDMLELLDFYPEPI